MIASVDCWVVIPIKESPTGKSRLSSALDPEQRASLVSSMLRHVVEAALAASEISQVFLVGPSRHGMSETIPLLPDPGQGLNAAVSSAIAQVTTREPGRPARVIVLAADLPTVTPREVDLLALAPKGAIAIATDRHGVGTNAISLPLPAAKDFTFAFGVNSLLLHQEEAERLGLGVETVISPGLERDIDEPVDLLDAESITRRAT